MKTQSTAAQVLELWKATFEQLPTSSEQEADWIATLDGCKLLIEEKTKFDEPTAEVKRKSALTSGEMYSQTLPLTAKNVLSNIVKKSSKQLLSSSSKTDYHLKILWFNSVGFDAEAKHFQLIATLYGSTNIAELNQSKLKECYFFRNSDFFRFKDQLDGAVVLYFTSESSATMKLCLNPYSKNWEALRDSPYAKKFLNGIIDPIADEATGNSYIADTNIDRNNKAAVLDYLQNKYKLDRITEMDLNIASVVFTTPK